MFEPFNVNFAKKRSRASAPKSRIVGFLFRGLLLPCHNLPLALRQGQDDGQGTAFGFV